MDDSITEDSQVEDRFGDYNNRAHNQGYLVKKKTQKTEKEIARG